LCGDLLKLSNTEIGKLVGFDYTHMPHHMNRFMRLPKRKSVKDQTINLDDIISFTKS